MEKGFKDVVKQEKMNCSQNNKTLLKDDVVIIQQSNHILNKCNSSNNYVRSIKSPSKI